jgi:hypothetical protein
MFLDPRYKMELDYNRHELYEVIVKEYELFKEKYELKITKSEFPILEDTLHIGYLKLDSLKNN